MKSHCPFDKDGCTAECLLHIGEGDWETSPCALAHQGALAKHCNNEMFEEYNKESLIRIATALESIAKHFTPPFTPYSEE